MDSLHSYIYHLHTRFESGCREFNEVCNTFSMGFQWITYKLAETILGQLHMIGSYLVGTNHRHLAIWQT